MEKLPAMVTEFDEALWGSLVDHLTVNGKDDIVFTMSSGMEIKAQGQNNNPASSEAGPFSVRGAGNTRHVCYK